MNAFPMVARCALQQAIRGIVLNTCSCGEEKLKAYWQCPTCQLRDAIRTAASRNW